MIALSSSSPSAPTLREAYTAYYKSAEHTDLYRKDIDRSLRYWEELTDDPPIDQISNYTLSQFKEAFLSTPLESKIRSLLNQARRCDPEALQIFAQLGLPAPARRLSRRKKPKDDPAVIASIYDRWEELSSVDNIPEDLLFLLPSPARYNSVRRPLEAILNAVGPASPGNRYGQGLINYVPKARPAKEAEPDPVVATMDEVSSIYEACRVAQWPDLEWTGARPVDLWQALTVFVFNCACRRRDWLALRKDQVDFKRMVITIRVGKSRKSRTLPMNTVVQSHLRRIWNSTGERVFPFPNNQRDLYATWRAIQEEAGIHVIRKSGENRKPYYGFHEMRKTSLTEYYALDERAAQTMGTHSNMLTTMRHYVATTRKDGHVRQVAEKLEQPKAFTIPFPEAS